jgi:replicative DNA helicase
MISAVERELKSYSTNDYAEMFLGSVVGGNIDSVFITKVRKEHFNQDMANQLYDVLFKLHNLNGWVDYLSVVTDFAKRVGSADAKQYLDRIIAKVPSEFNPSKAIELLEDSFIRRLMSEKLKEVNQKINERPHSAPEILFALYEQIEGLTNTKIDYNVKKEFEKTSDDILTGNNETVIPTGINSIDKVVGGYSTQEVTFIGARPNHGKTTTAIALILSALDANPDKRIVFFSCEMGKEQIKRKFLANVSGVSSYRMRINETKEGDKEKLAIGNERLAKYQDRFYLYDNVFDLYTMNKICRSVNANIAFVDFITFMEDFDTNNPRMSVGAIGKGAKRFAKAHNMSYVFYSQLNRDSAKDGALPTMNGLAESDILTQIGSDIWLLWYKFKATLDEKDRHAMKIIFDKTRYTAGTDLNFYFDADLSILRDK